MTIVLNVRIVSPPDRTVEVARALTEHDRVTNVVVLPGSARKPVGDLVLCDIGREVANEVVELLSELRIAESGSVAMDHVDLSVVKGVQEPEAAGDEDAVVWEEFSEAVDQSSRLTWSFVVFLTIAVQIAGIGVLLDSTILIVGAMVLGPEFGPISAISFGLLNRDGHRLRTALVTLVVGYLIAIVITWACAFVAHALGWTHIDMIDPQDPQTNFIVKPDRYSFVVAVLAGAAGILSLTSEKSSVLVGVFISVTTVPAASYIALAAAMGSFEQIGPSALQLVINLSGMVVSGFITLAVLWSVWGRAGLRSRVWQTLRHQPVRHRHPSRRR